MKSMKLLLAFAACLSIAGCTTESKATPNASASAGLSASSSPSASATKSATPDAGTSADAGARSTACAAKPAVDAKSITTRANVVIFTQVDPTRTDSTGGGDLPHSDLCIVRPGEAPRVLVAGRGDPNDTDMKSVLADFDNLLLSPDETTLYFTSAAWATSSAAHAVNLQTGKERFLVDGQIDSTIDHGRFRGKILASHYRLDDAYPIDSPKYRGRMAMWSVLDPQTGAVVSKLPEDDKAREAVLAK